MDTDNYVGLTDVTETSPIIRAHWPQNAPNKVFRVVSAD